MNITLTQKIFRHRLAYGASWLLGIVWALGSEWNCFPTEYLPCDASTDYTVSLLSIFTAFGGTYLALKVPALKSIRRRYVGADAAARERLYLRSIGVRWGVATLSLWVNVVLYYASVSAASTKYCVLIAMIAMLFCYPSEGEYRRLSGEGAPSTTEKEPSVAEEAPGETSTDDDK